MGDLGLIEVAGLFRQWRNGFLEARQADGAALRELGPGVPGVGKPFAKLAQHRRQWRVADPAIAGRDAARCEPIGFAHGVRWWDWAEVVATW
jgi:hypothetical protein